MIQYFTTDSSELVTIDDQAALTADHRWINLESPTEDEINQIAQLFKVSNFSLSSVLQDQEISRVNFGKTPQENTSILLQYPKYETSPLGYLTHSTFPIMFIISEGSIITVSNHPASFIQHFVINQSSLQETITDHENFAARLIWFITKDFVTSLDKTAVQMDLLERQLTSATQNEQIYQIMAIQKTIIDFKSSLAQNQKVIDQIKQNDSLFSTTPLTKTISAVALKNEQAMTMANTQGEILEQYSNMVSSVVSNNLNAVMKVLTSLTLIMTIPTIIGGIYGMNVDLPGAKLVSAFTLLMLFTIVVCLITYLILKKRKYL